MKNKNLKKGIYFTTIGSLWWGLLGTFFFQYISYVGTIEVVVQGLWTCIILIITTIYLNKIKTLRKILYKKKNLIILFLTSFLILANWTTWIYAVSTKRIIDASYGYFIFPIINIFLGYLFFSEKINAKRLISILIVIIASIYLLLTLKSFPWVGIS